MTHSNYRFFLSLLFRLVLFTGFVFIFSAIIGSFFNDDKSLNLHENIDLTIQLYDLKPGFIKKIKVAHIPIWIYKRRDYEIVQLPKLTPLLADPLSVRSTQPKSVVNVFRSIENQYFVFKPIESLRSCSIRFIEDATPFVDDIYTKQKLTWLGGFTESCFGSVYDLAGRRYSNTGKNTQLNLMVPEYRITSKSQAQSINNSKQKGDVIQFDFKKMLMSQ